MPGRAAAVADEAAPDRPARLPAAAAPPQLVTDSEHWLGLVATLAEEGLLRGPARMLAENSGFLGHRDDTLRLALAPEQEHLHSPKLVQQLEDALAQRLGGPLRVRYELASPGETAQARAARTRDARQAEAERAFPADPAILQLVQEHGARILPDSIRPLDP